MTLSATGPNTSSPPNNPTMTSFLCRCSLTRRKNREQGQRLRFASVSVDSFAPAHLTLRAAFGSLPSGCPRRLGASRRNLRLSLPKVALSRGLALALFVVLGGGAAILARKAGGAVEQGQEREVRERRTQPAEGSPQGRTLREQSAAIPCPLWLARYRLSAYSFMSAM